MQTPADLLRQCWFLAGPTAGGKSSLAMELAPRLNAEIVALDSMTVYRGMSIGTAKPSAEDRALVPHHGFDIRDPWQEYSVADYLKDAEGWIRDILGRNRVPLFVGGTGLYLRSLLRGIFDGPPADWELRHRLEQQARDLGPESVHAELARLDPVTAARLPVADQRRIIRAIEITLATGRPASAQQQEQNPLPPDERPQHVYWLDSPREQLHRNINRRVEQMAADGLLGEVLGLRSLPHPLSRTARQALGYKEILDWLDTLPPGTPPPTSIPAPILNLIQTRTRQFAKRQCTWFRNLEECRVMEGRPL